MHFAYASVSESFSSPSRVLCTLRLLHNMAPAHYFSCTQLYSETLFMVRQCFLRAHFLLHALIHGPSESSR